MFIIYLPQAPDLCVSQQRVLSCIYKTKNFSNNKLSSKSESNETRRKAFYQRQKSVSSVKHGETNFYRYGIDFDDIARIFTGSGPFRAYGKNVIGYEYQ